MTYSVLYHPKVKKFVDKLDKIQKERLRKDIEELQENPFPKGCMKIEGNILGFEKEKILRVRVGDYRILYFTTPEDMTINVVRIDKRGRVYE